MTRELHTPSGPRRSLPGLLAVAALLGAGALAAASTPGAGRPSDRLADAGRQRLWQSWVDEALGASRDRPVVVVVKATRRCHLLRAGAVVASFRADLGRAGLADKLFAGDRATPEGRYRVTEKRDRGATSFYRALMLDYPNEDDREEYADAVRRGLVPRGRGIGGLIEIHGRGGRGVDWTDGCVAVADADMDRLFAAVEVGSPVVIVGTAELPAAPVGGRR